MKTLLLCIALISICTLNAQKDTLILNFKDKELTGLDEFNPKNGELYYLKIKGINMNIYKIILNKSDSSVTKPLDFSAFSMLDPSGLISLTSSLNHAISTNISNDERKATVYYKSNNHEKSTSQLYPTQNKKPHKSPPSILDELKNRDSILTAKAKSIADLSETYSEYFNTTVARFNRDNLSNNEFCVNNDSIISFENVSKRFRERLNQLAKQYDELGKKFQEFTLNKEESIKKEELKGTVASIQQKIDDTQAEIKKIQSKVSEENIKVITTKFSDIINNSSRTYTSLPLQFNGDKSKLSISIIPQEKESRLPSYHATYLFPKPSGFYMGIGPGLYYSNLYDQRFSTIGFAATDSTTNYRLVPEKQSKSEIGLSVLLKAGWKLSKYDKIGFHGTIGGGLSFTNPLKLRALYGGGISIGEKHCLSLDILGATGYVDVQSNTVNGKTIFTEKPESTTVSILKTGIAFSIGYVFTF